VVSEGGSVRPLKPDPLGCNLYRANVALLRLWGGFFFSAAPLLCHTIELARRGPPSLRPRLSPPRSLSCWPAGAKGAVDVRGPGVPSVFLVSLPLAEQDSLKPRRDRHSSICGMVSCLVMLPDGRGQGRGWEEEGDFAYLAWWCKPTKKHCTTRKHTPSAK